MSYLFVEAALQLVTMIFGGKASVCSGPEKPSVLVPNFEGMRDLRSSDYDMLTMYHPFSAVAPPLQRNDWT